MSIPNYEAANIDVEWFGIDLSSGWAEDTFLEIVPNSERVTHTAGADGQYGFSKMSDKGATISLTLQQTSPTNQKIAEIYSTQDIIGESLSVAPFSIIDKTGKSTHFLALNAVLTEVPTQTFGNSMGEKTWVWVCESYLQAEDTSTITSNLAQYLKFAL
jgi:hypothetical protein